jgi:hypothetical protein
MVGQGFKSGKTSNVRTAPDLVRLQRRWRMMSKIVLILMMALVLTSCNLEKQSKILSEESPPPSKSIPYPVNAMIRDSQNVASSNELSYKGDKQKANLYVYRRGIDTWDVVISIEKGKICGHGLKNEYFYVRFDNDKPTKFYLNNTFFNDDRFKSIKNSKRFINRLKKSKVVQIKFKVNKDSNQTAIFNITSFNNPTFLSIQKGK